MGSKRKTLRQKQAASREDSEHALSSFSVNDLVETFASVDKRQKRAARDVLHNGITTPHELFCRRVLQGATAKLCNRTGNLFYVPLLKNRYENIRAPSVRKEFAAGRPKNQALSSEKAGRQAQFVANISSAQLTP